MINKIDKNPRNKIGKNSRNKINKNSIIKIDNDSRNKIRILKISIKIQDFKKYKKIFVFIVLKFRQKLRKK